jgi:hypothetical protein
MDDEKSILDLLRSLAELQGVSPSDADLEGVRSFLDVILPVLADLERRLPADTPVE